MAVWTKRLFIAYLVTSPYYFFPSGGLQISTIFLALAIIVASINLVSQKDGLTTVRKSAHQNRYLLVFIALSSLINVIYYCFYGDVKFITSSLYFILNFSVIMMLLATNGDKKFFKNIKTSLAINIFLQLAIYLIGWSRYHPTDTYRLMGTFNDPNQMAFYIFLSILFIYVINRLQKSKLSKVDWAAWAVGLLLVVFSSSVGVLLGLATFGLLLAATHGRKVLKRLKKPTAIIIAASCLGVVILTTQINNLGIDIPILSRIENKATKSDGRNILEDRGLDTVIYYPEYLIYGAGEGDYARFPEQKNGGNEIHSSLIALLFYYGIIPVIFLLKWLYDTTKKVDWLIKIAFIAILIESFTLINYRQPLLWALLILPLVQLKLVKRSKNKTR
jgi:hypothetical protein